MIKLDVAVIGCGSWGRNQVRVFSDLPRAQGLGNAGIHVGLVLMVAYAVCIAAYGIGRPELRQSVAFFA